jgi:hypothetical protein
MVPAMTSPARMAPRNTATVTASTPTGSAQPAVSVRLSGAAQPAVSTRLSASASSGGRDTSRLMAAAAAGPATASTSSSRVRLYPARRRAPQRAGPTVR